VKIPVTIEQLDYRDGPVVEDFYRTVLQPNFIADELLAQDSLVTGLREGRAYALFARGADGAIVGGVVSDWFALSQVLLVSYLAVLDELRGQSIGGQLLEAASLWEEALSPRLMVGEVEDPRFYKDTGFGNPLRRVAFYENSGIRALPVPYSQPALRPDSRRVPHLLLMVGGGTAARPETDRMDGAIVEHFLKEYFELYEGPPRDDDPEYYAMLEHCRRPGGLPLVAVKDLPPLNRAPGEG
jgi:GNAT superfamily N-acetyltransferase